MGSFLSSDKYEDIDLNKPIDTELLQLQNFSLSDVRNIYQKLRRLSNFPFIDQNTFYHLNLWQRYNSNMIFKKFTSSEKYMNYYEFLCAISITAYSNMKEKIHLIFLIFDMDSNNSLDQEGILIMIHCFINGYCRMISTKLPEYNNLNQYLKKEINSKFKVWNKPNIVYQWMSQITVFQTALMKYDVKPKKHHEIHHENDNQNQYDETKEHTSIFFSFKPMNQIQKENYRQLMIYSWSDPYFLQLFEKQIYDNKLNKDIPSQFVFDMQDSDFYDANKSNQCQKIIQTMIDPLNQKQTKKIDKFLLNFSSKNLIKEKPFLTDRTYNKSEKDFMNTVYWLKQQNTNKLIQRSQQLIPLKQKFNQNQQQLPNLSQKFTTYLNKTQRQQNRIDPKNSAVVVNGKVITKDDIFMLLDHIEKITASQDGHITLQGILKQQNHSKIKNEQYYKKFNQNKSTHTQRILDSLFRHIDYYEKGNISLYDIICSLYPGFRISDQKKKILVQIQKWRKLRLDTQLSKMTDTVNKDDQKVFKIGIKSLNRVKDIFNLFDKNKKGYLTRDDFFANNIIDLNEIEAKKLYDSMKDKYKTDKISLPMFMQFIIPKGFVMSQELQDALISTQNS